MERSTAILIALSTFLLALLAVGWRAQRQTRDADGFYLGGRTLGPWVTALAANASSSSAWSIVGVSGFAYQNGLTALWLLPGCVGGFLLNWFVIAPRLRADTGQAITLTDYLAGPLGAPGRQPIALLASMLTLASLLTYVASQMQAAGAAFGHAFATDPTVGIAIGAGVTVLYTLLGGYLAASVTDTVQGLLMVMVAVVLPIAAVLGAGGPGALWQQIAAVEDPRFQSGFAGREGSAAAAYAAGLIGIGLGYAGQPHAVNKFMGMAKDASMTVARTVGISWAVLLYAGMILVGWAVRAGYPIADQENAVYEASAQLLPLLLDGVVIASVLAAIMSTVDSQLLVCASTVTHDLGLARRFPQHMLAIARSTVLTIGVGALVAAILLPKNVFDNVLFAWAALGSAFGPLLLVRLWRGPVRPQFAFWSMLLGGGTAIVGSYVQVLAPGFADRVLSWLLALAVALWGSRSRRSN